MGLVKYSAPVDEVAGSIAGVTFQRTAAGHVARLRAKPNVRRTPDFARYTSLLSSYSWKWFNLLTNAQRVAWDAVAATTTWVNSLGQNYSPTGIAAYIRCAISCDRCNYAAPSDPPTTLDEADPVLTISYSSPDHISIDSYGTLASPPDGRLRVERSDLLSPTINYFSGKWTTGGHHLISTLPGPPWTVLPFAAVHPDSCLFFSYRVVRYVNPGAPPPNYIGQCSHRYTLRLFIPAAP